MTRIYLSHFSAFALLRYARVNKAKIEKCRYKTMHTDVPNKKTLKNLHNIICDITNQNFMLDVILYKIDKKSNYDFAKFHNYKKQLSSKLYYKIYVNDAFLQESLFDKICISSPELCFVQMSRNFPIPRLLWLAMELCGTYALDFMSDMGFVSNIPPATSIRKLYSVCKTLSGLHIGNIKIAKYTLKWIENNSASPAETKLYILLCGPRKLGYFQVGHMFFNREIYLSNEAFSICDLSKIRPDLSCSEKMLAIEYDSKFFHEDVKRSQNDKLRVQALMHDGWNVVTIIPQVMKSYEVFSTFAFDILRYMGKDKRIKSKSFEQKSYKAFIDMKNLGHKNKL